MGIWSIIMRLSYSVCDPVQYVKSTIIYTLASRQDDHDADDDNDDHRVIKTLECHFSMSVEQIILNNVKLIEIN